MGNNSFDKLCRESRIKRHKTCPNTPQQNKVSERMNRTIMDNMLYETRLGGEFWAKAGYTAVYIINRSPDVTIEFDVLEVVWTGSKSDYSHIRSSGCVAYVHIVKDKIIPRATKGIYCVCTKNKVIHDLVYRITKDCH